MSRKVTIQTLTETELREIEQHAQACQQPSKYAYSSRPTYIPLYQARENKLYIPFAFNQKYPRPKRNQFPIREISFEGELRPEQQKVKTETINNLNKNGSTIIASYTGFGKCLQENTPILMYDGSIKWVQDIITGDEIMGDNSKCRKVLSICRGKEQMYSVITPAGNFGANVSHILSLKALTHKCVLWNPLKQAYMVRWLNKKTITFKTKYFFMHKDAITFKNSIHIDDTLDISINDYLQLHPRIKNYLRLYKVGVEFPYQETEFDPYLVGFFCGSNSQLNIGKYYSLPKIPHEYIYNSRNIRLKLLAGIIDSDGYFYENSYKITQIGKDLSLNTEYLARSLGFAAYTCKLEKYYLTNVYGEGLVDIPVRITHKKASDRYIENSLLYEFKIKPIEDTKYYGFILDGNGRFLLGNFTVTHNTAVAIYVATKIKMKTLILCHRIILIKQWEESIKKFCPQATYEVLTPKSDIHDVDFYIINSQNVPKRDPSLYSHIGFLICDEIHIIMAEKLSKSMQYIVPRYVLGLSATPYRTDGLNSLFEMYFGPEKIVRTLYRKHTVYYIYTQFTPEIKFSKSGKVDWGSVIDSQANNIDRNELIIGILRHFSNNVFLVLCKRVSQANYLVHRLQEEKEDVTSLIGKQQEYQKNSRILIGTCQKAGVGFDHPRLNSLILASDIEQYFVQYLGRCFRTETCEPVIFDIIDNYILLQKHFQTRCAVYLKHGGIIKDFFKEFPNYK